jgi:hypothetical protein
VNVGGLCAHTPKKQTPPELRLRPGGQKDQHLSAVGFENFLRDLELFLSNKRDFRKMTLKDFIHYTINLSNPFIHATKSS